MEAGWSAVLRLPRRGGDGELAERVVAGGGGGGASGVVLWDGGGERVVVSLIGPEAEFAEGVRVIDVNGDG